MYISAIKYEFLVVEWMVFESFDYIIINEAECLQQLYLSKTFQRNVFSSVISHKKIEWLMQNYISNRNIATQYQEKSCKSLGILLYLCGQILSKADKTETCKFFMNIVWICYSYTTAITFLVFYYYYMI